MTEAIDYKSKLRQSNYVKKYSPKVMQLEDKLTGKHIDFNLYDDKSVPFLNPDDDKNQLILKNIIDGDMDDDCQTDED